MPPRKNKKRKSTRRRRYKKKYQVSYPMGTPGGIRQRFIKMRYVERLGLQSTTGALATYVFRATSLFDPNFTGTGHQPFMFDSMASFYNRYVVIGSKITATFTNDDSDNKDPCDVGIYLSKDVSPPYTQMDEFVEAGKGTFKVIQSEARKPTSVSSFYSAKKFWNIKDIKDNIDKLGSTVSTTPGENGYFQIYAQAYNGATINLNCRVVMEFAVIFSEPKDVVPS